MIDPNLTRGDMESQTFPAIRLVKHCAKVWRKRLNVDGYHHLLWY
ncbi:hypothetical protein RMSM_02053 [Rhodopirellula maiorica SM1]|uniref:Uncharacterized protein n=1 Tax=Rhodopirellula maiorica SM1 TaxID=1265738 RepID=M5RNV1_9BACT|nr:hypothetical protein RMSM_02053 [Rhodopirellula maiorica SM1]